ncbi:MAG TPA: amino acid permease, partial [Firmicutes bacterium]|nr:amino acid permease [Bacillota bacterium]
WLGYGAWVAILSAIEEVREPHRTVPLALTYTLAITTVFYTAIMLVSTGATGGQGFDSGLGAQAPLVYAATYFSVKGLVSFLAKLVVPIAALLACLTTMNVLMLDGSRVLYAMSRDGDLPHVYSYLHPRFRTPVAGILTVAVLALVGLFCPQYVFYIVQVGAFGNSFAFLLAMLSFIWANKGTATWKSVLALVSALSIVVVATTYEPVTYRLALIWGAIGAVVGLAWRLVLRGRKESGSV